MNMLRKFFGLSDKSESSESIELESLRVELDDLKNKNTELWKSCNKFESRALSAESKVVEIEKDLKSKLREQNDADLLLVSIRIANTIVSGKKPAADDLARQQALQINMKNYSHYGYPSAAMDMYGQNSLLNTLGLGQVFP